MGVKQRETDKQTERWGTEMGERLRQRDGEVADRETDGRRSGEGRGKEDRERY